VASGAGTGGVGTGIDLHCHAAYEAAYAVFVSMHHNPHGSQQHSCHTVRTSAASSSGL
jgi:hypothetical protein